MTDEVRFEQSGPLGLMTLNRPRALNALTLDMIRAMDRQLSAWATDDTVKAVIVQGNGKAFCAGGDVVGMVKAIKADPDDHGQSFLADYFGAEYTLDRRTRHYPKPYITILDGATMGGGVGISHHGKYSVVTENTVWAMPEMAIGFYPDVGMTYGLSRLPGDIGTWLGLTGARLEAADLLHLKLAAAFMPSAEIAAFLANLAEQDWSGDPFTTVESHLARSRVTMRKPAPITPHVDIIGRCYKSDTVEDILAALEREEGAWAEKQRHICVTVSPSSLKVTLQALRQASALEFDQCLTMEFRLSLAFGANHDFPEGVRAMLIDKDKSPRWRPASLSDVSDHMVDAYFTPRSVPDLLY